MEEIVEATPGDVGAGRWAALSAALQYACLLNSNVEGWPVPREILAEVEARARLATTATQVRRRIRRRVSPD